MCLVFLILDVKDDSVLLGLPENSVYFYFTFFIPSF